MLASPTKTLIENRCRDLGLTRKDVIGRLGYQNRSKGARRYDELLAGALMQPRQLSPWTPDPVRRGRRPLSDPLMQPRQLSPWTQLRAVLQGLAEPLQPLMQPRQLSPWTRLRG